MGALLDIIGSLVVRGSIVAIMVTVTYSLHNALYVRTSQSIAQQKVATVSEIMKSDIKQIGYNTSLTPVLTMSASDFRFIGDLDNNGVVDSIRYHVAIDSILYRTVNSASPAPLLYYVSMLAFKYTDMSGVVTADRDLVKTISIKIATKEPNVLDDIAPKGFWEGIINPPNI